MNYKELKTIIVSLNKLDKIAYSEMEDGFDTIYDLGELGDHEIKVDYKLHIDNGYEFKEVAQLEILGVQLFKDDKEVILSPFENEVLKQATYIAYHETEEKIIES